MDKKKVVYTKSSVDKKIKKTFLFACVGLAIVFALVSIVSIIIISSYSMSQLALFDNSSDHQVAVRNIAILFIIITLVVTGWVTFIVVKKSVKTLHKGICKPMLELILGIRKANEGLEDIGIVMAKDTEDEITLINSVYFKMAKQLKTHVDDIMKLSGLTEKFENSAHYDALTGVYNRRRFGELIQTHAVIAAKKNEPTFICMLDLDLFKKVNDTYGHAAGDEVLKVVAERVKGTVRPYDLFGRYGGEEFVMFLSAPDAEIAVNFAERIRTIVYETPVHFEGIDIPVSTSIGVAQMAPTRNYENAIKAADEALYKAKKNGRNRVELHDESSK
ncbi:MAG: GGDEF domain-containing protein [Oscillospiraceae bacterium]|nr:GGDEF domain-containing protein [Oscillospiraceae bacterium]